MTMGMGEIISNRNHGGVRASKFPASAKKGNTSSSGSDNTVQSRDRQGADSVLSLDPEVGSAAVM